MISLPTLIAVHLHTHSSTSNHSKRAKYRSAIYFFNDKQALESRSTLTDSQKDFSEPLITDVLPFKVFNMNHEQYLNYYFTNPEKPFCRNIFSPKIKQLIKRFAKEVKPELHQMKF